MMTTTRLCRRTTLVPCAAAAVLIAGALFAAPQPEATRHRPMQPGHDAAATRDHIFLTPAQMQWRDGPEALPDGAEYAILQGDPGSEGPFTLRLRVPADYRIPPHTHPRTEHVTVLEGTLNFGMGARMDTDNGTAIPEGGFAVLEPGVQHYAWAGREGAVIQLHGTGPWEINYVNPDDDPRGQR